MADVSSCFKRIMASSRNSVTFRRRSAMSRLTPLLFNNIPVLTVNCLCFHRHTGFPCDLFKTAPYFHRHSRVVRTVLNNYLYAPSSNKELFDHCAACPLPSFRPPLPVLEIGPGEDSALP